MASTPERLRFTGGTVRAASARPWRTGAGRDSSDAAPYSTFVHRSIHEVGGAAWDALNGQAAVVRSHACLAAIEDAGIAGCRWFFPVVRNARGDTVAQACVAVVMTDLAQALPGPLRRAVGLVRRLRPGFLHARVAECGAPMVAAHGLTFAPGRATGAVLGALEQAVAGIAETERCGLVVFRDFAREERPLAEPLGALGYRRLQSVPRARLALRWTCYEDYRRALRSRYRKDVRRRLARVRAAGQTVRVRTRFGAEAARWAAQSRAVQASSRGFRRESPTAAYYANLDRALGEDSVLLTVEQDGAATAHGMVVLDGENAVATYFGREPGPPGAEWFHLLDSAIRLAIERGCRSVHLGRGSFDAKSLVGADVEPLWVYVRCRRTWLNRVLALLPERVVSRPELTRRRVFRDD